MKHARRSLEYAAAVALAVAAMAAADEARQRIDDHLRRFSPAVMIHWGARTFPRQDFAPERPDPWQWAETAKAGGFRAVLFVAKHHDGFCMWRTDTTDYCAPKGPTDMDYLGALAQACRQHGLGLGVYVSPADLHAATSGLYAARGDTRPVEIGGDTYVLDRYNEYFCRQLWEVMTRYGEIQELFLDGYSPQQLQAIPMQKREWERLVRACQPTCAIFDGHTGEIGELIWEGSERAETPPRLPAIVERNQRPYLRQRAWKLHDKGLGNGWFAFETPGADPAALCARLTVGFRNTQDQGISTLVNINPDLTGTIPETTVEALRMFGVHRKARANEDDGS
jgi:alpha-L-fucosidase